MGNGERMQGRRVLVTGSGTGIGRGMAVEFAREGAAVALHYSHSAAGAQEAVQQIRDAGGRAEAFQADFTDVEQAQKLATDAIDFLGGLDVLVNNAGITVNRAFEKVTPEQYDTLFDVNVKAMFFVTQAAGPTLAKDGGGTVINITSGHAYTAMVEHSVYAATKAAIVGLTRTLSIELIQKGIRVNAIAPGWVLVENQEEAMPDDFDEKDAALTVPAGFIGEARDIARLAIFLASDESRFIVGQTYICDGGQTFLMPGTDFRNPAKVQYGGRYVPGLDKL